MTNGIDAGNVFLQAEQIKGLRAKNQANLLAQQRGAQFRPLLAQQLASPQDQDLRNQLIALDPQAAQQAFGAQTAATGAQQSQFDLSEDRAARGVSLADAVIKSKSPKALLMNVDPELVTELEKQGVDIEAMTDAEAVRFATDVRDQFLPRTSQEFRANRAGGGITAGQREFRARVSGANLNATELEEANRVALGLSPRATGAAQKIFMIGDVPHIFDPNSGEAVPVNVRGKDVTTRTVADSEAEVLVTKERAKGDAVLANKTIASGFATIDSIRRNVINLERAKQELLDGATTGAVSRLFPSFRAATIRLENTQKELGLDVIGAVTFGALSKGELDLALSKALPTGLKRPELINWIDDRINAQTKLSDYYDEQINFLSADTGHTVNEWRQLKRQEQAQQVPQQEAQQGEVPQFQEGQVVTQGGVTFRFINGEFVEQ